MMPAVCNWSLNSLTIEQWPLLNLLGDICAEVKMVDG
jgi:hypothetical protein